MTKARKKNYIHTWNETLADINTREFGSSKSYAPLKQNREIGVEIECEGTNLPMDNFNGWSVHVDGSLRAGMSGAGSTAYEYVFEQPMSRGDTMVMIDRLDDVFSQRNVELYEASPRTSVHVHINQRGLTIKQICNQIAMYLVFEELLSDYCGKHRKGNLFCLRACDSESIIDEVVHALRNNTWRRVADDHMRYAGMNLAALFKFGTIEYRTMRCTRNLSVIKTWVDILCRLKDKALEFDNPRDIVKRVFDVGGRAFTAETLGVHAMIVESSANMDMLIRDGARTARDMAYAVDWAANPTKLGTGWTGAKVPEEDDAPVPQVDAYAEIIGRMTDRIALGSPPASSRGRTTMRPAWTSALPPGFTTTGELPSWAEDDL